MVGSSKILTVSYGTFSCTLEGFDDSFDTMKAIAEYFRDLASDDRYFGAEPPTPDAEMLARIAEREVSRRVEARTEGTGIVLRAGNTLAPMSAPAQAAPAQPSPAPASAQQPPVQPAPAPATEAPAPQVAETAPPTPRPAMPPTPSRQPAEADFDADSVAAKLRRIRAVVGRQASMPIGEEEDEANLAPVSRMPDTATPQEPFTAMTYDDAEEVEDDRHEPSAVTHHQAAAEVHARAAESEDLTEDDEPGLGMPIPARARVVRMPQGPLERFVEEGKRRAAVADEAAEPIPAGSVTPAADRGDSRRGQFEDLDEDDLAAEAERRLLAELADHEDELDVPEDDRTATLELRSDDRVEVEEPVEALSDETSEEEDVLAEMGDSDTDEDVALAAAVAASLAGDDSDDDRSEPAVSEDDAADAVEAEDGHDAPTEAITPPQPVRDNHAHLRHEPEEDEAAMSRILSATDARMADPESSRRRDAISQLKAAVAATEAARRLGDSRERGNPAETAFRDDLRHAVHPRRPVMPNRPAPRSESADAGQTPTRSERPRPAPLKLVASQRVDLSESERTPARGTPRQVTPVRPRRVSVAEQEQSAPVDAPAVTPTEAAPPPANFAAFAAQMGAHDLSEVLEAAAAYTSFVEGIEDFSRPQLMQKVQEAMAEPVSREDGLRSFGTLIRRGTLTKVRNGRFQVTEESRFNPQRRAG